MRVETDVRFINGPYCLHRDGILMQASAVAMSLMKYSVGEVKRRGRHSSAELRTAQRSHKPTARATAAGGSASSGVWDQPAVDLEDLVRVLQRSENHLLATRILYSSWHNGPAKSEVLWYPFPSLSPFVIYSHDANNFPLCCLLVYCIVVAQIVAAGAVPQGAGLPRYRHAFCSGLSGSAVV